MPEAPAYQIQRVTTGRNGWRWLGYAGVALLLLAAGFWIGDQGKADVLSSALSRAELREEVRRLQGEVETLSSRLAIAERSAQVADSATEQVRQQMISRQNDLRELRSELDFYRGIVAARGGSPGLRVHAFDPRPGAAPGAGVIDLVLVRGRPDGKAVTGRVELRLLPAGVDISAPAKLYAQSEPAATAAFSFDFYQKLELRDVATENTATALVTLVPDGKKAKPVHSVHPWPVAGS